MIIDANSIRMAKAENQNENSGKIAALKNNIMVLKNEINNMQIRMVENETKNNQHLEESKKLKNVVKGQESEIKMLLKRIDKLTRENKVISAGKGNDDNALLNLI